MAEWTKDERAAFLTYMMGLEASSREIIDGVTAEEARQATLEDAREQSRLIPDDDPFETLYVFEQAIGDMAGHPEACDATFKATPREVIDHMVDRTPECDGFR